MWSVQHNTRQWCYQTPDLANETWWIMQPVVCPIQRDVDVYVAISYGREVAETIGFNKIDRARIEIVILELTRNLLAHAGGGTIQFESVSHANQCGMVGMAITANDTGPGIPDIALALQDGYSTTHTLGAGLPGVKRLMDEFAIDSIVGMGTTVRAIKWLPEEHHRKEKVL
jgi:serine/threonine-protein kinase RsbT